MAELIPPAIIEILGSDAQFLRTMAGVQATLEDFSKQNSTTNLDASTARVDTGIADAVAKGKAFAKETWYAGLGVDLNNVEIDATLASLQATITAAKADKLIDTYVNPVQVAKTLTTLDLQLKAAHETITVDAELRNGAIDQLLTSVDATLAGAKAEKILDSLAASQIPKIITDMDRRLKSAGDGILIGAKLNNEDLDTILASVDATIAAAHEDIRIGAELDEASVAKVMAEANAFTKALDTKLIFGLPSLPAELEALAGGKGGGGGIFSRLGGIGGSGGGGGLSESLGWGGDSGGFLSKLMSPLTMISTLFSAKFGSLGSLMGFGPEHLATTVGGIAGLGLEGGAGAGLLGMGAAGKAAVGSGSDMLVSSEALRNISQYRQGLITLPALEKKVGDQAAISEVQLSNSWSKTSAMFDKLTGPAQTAFTKIGQSILGLANSYIPLIAKSAQTNFGIIEKSIQPVLKWLEGTGPLNGKGIFADLEKQFAGSLPTDIAALSSGLEHLLRVVDMAAKYTGAFMKAWGKKEAWDGTAAGIALTSSNIARWIGDFRLVDKFIKLVGQDLRLIFTKDAGTATAIIKEMNKGLEHLQGWIKSIGGSNELKELFNVHKGETLELMKSMADMLTSFGGAYLKVAPFFVTVVTDILKIANALFQFSQKIPGISKIVAFGTALFIMEAHAKTVTKTFGLLKDTFNVFSNLGKYVQSLGAFAAKLLGMGAASEVAAAGTDELATSEDVAAGSSVALNTALGIGVLGAVIALGIGIYELVKHWKTVWSAIKGVAADVWGWLKSTFDSISSFIGSKWGWLIALFAPPIGPLVALAAHWKQVWGEVKRVADVVWHALDSVWSSIKSGVETAWKAISGFLHSTIGQIVIFITMPIVGLVNFLVQHWSTIKKDVVNAWDAVIKFLKGVGPKIIAVFKDAGKWLYDAGKAIVQGLINGIKNLAGKAVDIVKGLGHDLINGAKSILHIFSPSQDFIEIGQYVVKGLSQGIGDNSEASTITTTLTTLSTKMLAVFKKTQPQWVTTGTMLMQGLSQGINAAAGSVATNAAKAATSALAAAKTATKTSSPSQLFAELGQNWMLGLVKGVAGNSSAVRGAVVSAATSAAGPLPPGSLGGGRTGGAGGFTFTWSGDVIVQSATGSPADTGTAVQKALQKNNQTLVTAFRTGAGSVNN